MKVKLRKSLLCVALGISCFSTGVMADSFVKTIKAEQRMDIEITKSYQKQWLRDGNGKTVYPIMYNGNTYLPLRSVAEMLGAEITWDGVNKRVNIEPKVQYKYITISNNTNTNNSSNNSNTSSKPTYSSLTTKDKAKVKEYESEIDKLETKVKRYEDKLEDLYDDEYDAKKVYNESGSVTDRNKLDKIRDDIEYYEDLVYDLEKSIDKLEDKIDAIYDKY